ncbi:MAG: hypothetical protein ACLP4R_04495 [Solirubrobacteraceae bacterium]
MEGSSDRQIARIAARQRTLVSWDQLLASGLGPDAIDEKDLVFRGAGLDVLRFTGDHVEKQLTMVLARIAGELARRAVAD